MTTLVDLGNRVGGIDQLRREHDNLNTPHILIAGPILTPVGGYPQNIRLPGLEVSSVDEAIEWTTRLIEQYEVDLIKVAIAGGWNRRIPLEKLQAIVATAHSYDKSSCGPR